MNNTDLPLNNNALYPFSSTRNTSLLVGIAFQKPESKYQIFLTYAHNEIAQLYNGGILTTDPNLTIDVIDDIIDGANELAVGTSVPVNLPGETSNLRFRIRRFAMTQYLQLGGSTSENNKSSRIFNVQHLSLIHI